MAKTIKLLAISYLIKTLLVGVAWLFVPDLPARSVAWARETWTRLGCIESPRDAKPPVARPLLQP
jgi:hypothetical protein